MDKKPVSRPLRRRLAETSSSPLEIDYSVSADESKLNSIETQVRAMKGMQVTVAGMGNLNVDTLTIGVTPSPSSGPDTIVTTSPPLDVASQKGARWPLEWPWTTFEFVVCGAIIFVCICVTCIVIVVCCCLRSKNKGQNDLDQKAVRELIAADIKSYRKEFGGQIMGMGEQNLSDVEKEVRQLDQKLAAKREQMGTAEAKQDRIVIELLSAPPGTGRSGRNSSGGNRRSHHGAHRSGGRHHGGGHSGGEAPRFEGAAPSWAMKFYNDGVQ